VSIVTPAVESYIDRLRAQPDRHPELTAALTPVGDGVLIAVKR
jgi:predicted O-methyltransferase YrrM